MNPVEKVTRSVDRFQQSHRTLAFPFAVVKKFGDDQAGYLAALIAYYGFFSLFPLLLVLVSVLGILLSGNPSLQRSILDSALKDFPVIGDQIQKNIHAITGNAVTLAIGIAGTLWAGLGVTMAAQNAMNRVWNIPRSEWPNFVFSRLRGLLILGLLGTITVVATFASGFGTTGAWWRWVAGIVVSALLNLVLYLLSFRILTAKELTWNDVLPGSIVAAVVWTALETLGGYYVTHQLKSASSVYGTFAVVIGLLVWIYLGAQVTLYCAEINVVRKQHLWPRSLVQPPLTEGDREVISGQALGQRMRPEQRVDVTFDEAGGDDPSRRSAAG
jgi:YihY family inner membrane protein